MTFQRIHTGFSTLSCIFITLAISVSFLLANSPLTYAQPFEIDEREAVHLGRELFGSAKGDGLVAPTIRSARPLTKIKPPRIVPNPPSSQRIAGGINVRRGQYPYTALVITDKGMCSGSVVHKYAVLTAAHCVVTAKSAVIKIGLVDQRAPKSSYDTIQAKTFIWPSTYSYNYRGGVNENDIALIILSKPSRFAPAPMASSKAKLKKLQSTTAIGWGITAETQRTITRYLQTQNFPYLDPKTCKKYSGLNDPKMVCTGWNMKKYKVNICTGDSGGPLLAKNGRKNVIVGVVSGSYGNCGKSYGPNLYSSVALWRTWLDGMIKKYAKARAVVVPKPKPLPPKPRPPPSTPKPPPSDYDYDYDYWWFL